MKEQIDEMAKEMCECCREAVTNNTCEDSLCIGVLKHAEALYNAGYRKQEWISVEERLPETEGYYLVWNKEQNRIEIRFFYRLPPNYPVEIHPEIREYFGNFADYKRITHWMPLPKPPKMKGGAR